MTISVFLRAKGNRRSKGNVTEERKGNNKKRMKEGKEREEKEKL